MRGRGSTYASCCREAQACRGFFGFVNEYGVVPVSFVELDEVEEVDAHLFPKNKVFILGEVGGRALKEVLVGGDADFGSFKNFFDGGVFFWGAVLRAVLLGFRARAPFCCADNFCARSVSAQVNTSFS